MLSIKLNRPRFTRVRFDQNKQSLEHEWTSIKTKEMYEGKVVVKHSVIAVVYKETLTRAQKLCDSYTEKCVL